MFSRDTLVNIIDEKRERGEFAYRQEEKIDDGTKCGWRSGGGQSVYTYKKYRS